MKMYEKILLVAVIVGLLVAGAFAYRRATVVEKPIVYIHENVGNPFYTLHSLGFWDACEDFGLDCKEFSTDAGGIEAKLNQCDLMLAAGGASGAMFSVYDSSFEACIQQLECPWINIHGQYNSDEAPFLAMVTLDAREDAARAARAMAEKVGGKGTVIVIQSSFNSFENMAVEGFCGALESEFDMECTEPIEAGVTDRMEGIAMVAAQMARYPDAVGAYASTAMGPVYMTTAAQERGYGPGDLVFIGNDATKENLDLLETGWVYALVAQPAYEENYEAVRTYAALKEGKEIEANQVLEALLVTRENAGPYVELADRMEEYIAAQ